MELPEWLSARERGALAIIRGGQPHGVLQALIEALDARTIILADRPLAGKLTPELALKQAPRVELRLSRGFLRDLEQERRQSSGHTFIIPAQTLESDARGEMRRAHDQLVVLAGYPARPELVSLLVAHQFAVAIRRLQDRQACPIVVHDRLGWLPATVLDEPQTFYASEREGEDTAAELPSDIVASFRPPTVNELAMQSEYIVRTAMPVLIDMHRWLAGPACAGLLGYWREQLANAPDIAGHELFVGFAQDKLKELVLELSQVART